MKIKYELKKVKPNIFAVVIKDDYDRAMTFCRVQEYYESANNKFRGKEFSIWDYMKWYSEEYMGFTYGVDWLGFNLPYDVALKCYEDLLIKETPYDDEMYDILMKIKDIMDVNSNAYVIGAGDIEGETFTHEVCHGLWYTNPEYKKEAKIILNTIKPSHKKIFRKNLLLAGYPDKVIDDEIQAYLTISWDCRKFGTGINLEKIKKYHNVFITTLEKFIKE